MLGPVHLALSSTIRLGGTRTRNPQHDAAPSTRYRTLQPATHHSTKTEEKIRGDDDFTTMMTTTTTTTTHRIVKELSVWRSFYSFFLRSEKIAI